MSIAGQKRPASTAGRHRLPDGRPSRQNQQFRAACSAVPALQSAAMERWISTPPVNGADLPPYRTTAEADKDREEAIAMVNSGRQFNDAEHSRQYSEARPACHDSKGSLLSSRGREGPENPEELMTNVEAAEMLLTLKASKASGESDGTDLPPPPRSPEDIEPKRRRLEEGTKTEKARVNRNWKKGQGEPEAGEPREETANEEKPYQCECCPLGYGRKDHLKRHVETQHNPVRKIFLCDICGDSWHSRRDNLRQHRKIHGADGPEPEPIVWHMRVDEHGNEIRRWPADQPEPVTDGGAQVGEDEADTIDSLAQPVQKVEDSEPTNRQTTREEMRRFTPINKPTARG